MFMRVFSAYLQARLLAGSERAAASHADAKIWKQQGAKSIC